MKRLLAAAGTVAVLLAGCGGVDRAGTREDIVDAVDEAGGTADEDCIDDVFGRYTDDQLEAINEQFGESSASLPPDAAALQAQLYECITITARARIVTSAEDAGGTVDEACVDAVFGSRSSAEIAALDEEFQRPTGSMSPAAATLVEEVRRCVTFES